MMGRHRVYLLAAIVFCVLPLVADAAGKISRPNLSASGVGNAASRQAAQIESDRIKEKKKMYPELFGPKRVLGPMKTTYPPEKSSCGQTILHDRIVTTAVIVTDELVAKYDVLTDTEQKGSTTISSSSSKDQTESKLAEKMDNRLKQIHKRHENIRQTLEKLPLSYEEWPSVLAGACPASFMTQGKASHKASERGVALAHAQIWEDWYYRNNEAELAKMTEEEMGAMGPGGRTKNSVNTNPRCTPAIPSAYRDITSNTGSIKNDISLTTSSEYKNFKKQHSNDLLVVFEDDTVSNISSDILGPALIRELDNMQVNKIDLLFLGWCYGKGLRSMPMCAHAYVITRHMASILLENFEPCGVAIDAQWHALDRRKMIKWAKAHPESYNGTTESTLQDVLDGRAAMQTVLNNPNDAEYFRGMFQQGKMGSFNAHEWMPV